MHLQSWPFLPANFQALLLRDFERQHGRPPTQDERLLVFDYVNAMFRDVPHLVLEGRTPKEAVALGSQQAVREAVWKQRT